MKRLLRLLRLRSQVRYWRKRAWLAEARLEAESNRNRQREDMFVSASVMGARGMWGVPPRVGPALQQHKRTDVPASPLMTGADQLEFETFWLPDARLAGVSAQQALAEFTQELQKRKVPLNDDPYSH